MTKKIFYWTSTILQVIFLIGIYGIQYFSVKRMGMMRYVVFKNNQWESNYPITTLKYGAIVLLVILCITAILYIKNKKSNYSMDKKTLPMLIAGILITIIFVLFTLIFSTENYISYYFTVIILGIIGLIQYIKILLTSFIR